MDKEFLKRVSLISKEISKRCDRAKQLASNSRINKHTADAYYFSHAEVLLRGILKAVDVCKNLYELEAVIDVIDSVQIISFPHRYEVRSANEAHYLKHKWSKETSIKILFEQLTEGHNWDKNFPINNKDDSIVDKGE